MNAAYQTIFNTVFEEYEDSKRYPNGLCDKCRRNLDGFKAGNLNTIPNFTKYGPTAINVDESSSECVCHICQITKQNGLVKNAYFWKIQKGGSNAPSLGSESKYANGLDDPKLNGAVLRNSSILLYFCM